MKSQYMRVSAVAECLELSKKRVYAMIQEGKLDAVRLGPRQTRVPRQSVDSLIARAIEEARRRER